MRTHQYDKLKKKEPKKKEIFQKKYLKIFENFYDEKISEVIGRRIKLKRSEGPEDPEDQLRRTTE